MNNNLIEEIECYLNNNEVNELVKLDLNRLKKSIKKSQENLSNNEYELAFVGQSHAGKTTIISSILGLYYENEKGKMVQVMHSDEGGRTTPCTIEIIPDNQTIIEVVPKDRNELKGIINEYCYFITGNGGILSEEIRTIIKKRIKKEIRDQLRKNKDVEEAKREIEKEVNINNINTDLFALQCDKEEKNDVFKWINKILYDIRRGNLEELIIPDKIIIHINSEFINIPSGIVKIIDTRGISSETAKTNNNIVGRKDLDEYVKKENTIVIYINEFSSIEGSVVDFYQDKLTSFRTEPEDLIKFMVLINAKNGSIRSKIEDEDEIEEFIEDKKLEFTNAVLINEEDERLNKLDLKERYSFIKDTIVKVGGKIANFIVYEPLQGMNKSEESGNSYFFVEDQEKLISNKNKFNEEIKEIISVRKKVIENKLQSDIKIVRNYISNQLGLSDNTVIGNAVNKFSENVESKVKSNVEMWMYKYITTFIELTKRMDGRTVAAYVRGYGRVVSRMETIVDDTYYFHKSSLKDLEEKLEVILEEQTDSFEEKVKNAIGDIDDIKPRDMVQIDARKKVQEFIDNISKELFIHMEGALVGNIILWDNVYSKYVSSNLKYADALNSIIRSIFTSKDVDQFNNKYVNQENVLKIDSKYIDKNNNM